MRARSGSRRLTATRAIGLFITVLLCLGAKPPEGRFFAPLFPQKLLAGTFDPFEFHTAAPPHIRFLKTGQAIIELGQEQKKCRFRMPADPDAIELKCERADWTKHLWKWMGPDSAESDILGERTMLTFLPKAYDAYAQEHAKLFDERERARLAAFYRGDNGVELMLPGAGDAIFDHRKLATRVVECLIDCDKKQRARCVVLGKIGNIGNIGNIGKVGKSDTEQILLIERSGALIEAENPGLCPEGLAYSPKEHGFTLVRTAGANGTGR